MSQVQRSSDVKEQIGTKAFMAIGPAIVLLILGGVMIYYKGMLLYLGILLAIGGIGLLFYGIKTLTELKKVTTVKLDCPFCKHVNHLVSTPDSDVRCVGCQRQIPIMNGRVLQVFQVRCGFCNHLNYYSEKSTGLICEECDRVIPIATDEGASSDKAFQNFAHKDDNAPYDLVLMDGKGEEIIGCLQKMLALNRNQVKQMMEEMPVTLLSGIPRKKAELLKAQIEMNHGKADFHESGKA